MRGLGVRQGDGLRPREQTGVVDIFNMRLRSIQRFNFLPEAHIYKLGLEINERVASPNYVGRPIRRRGTKDPKQENCMRYIGKDSSEF